jgi:hypothetical protein
MIWKPFFNLSPANIATHFSTKSKKRERERRKNTTQVVDMDKNILANDNTMDWFGFLGAIVALWSLIL